MEENILKENAKRLFHTADHLTYMVYPIVKDNKILLVAVKNLYEANKNAVDIIIENDRKNKFIGVVPQNFSLRLNFFGQNCAKRYRISEEVIKNIMELKEIVEEQKRSPIEFSRKEKYLIFSEGYEAVKSIDIKSVKNYLNSTRQILEVINKL